MSSETLYAQISDTGGLLIGMANVILRERLTITNCIDKSARYESMLQGNRTLNIPYIATGATPSVLTEGTQFTTNTQISTSSPSLTYRELGVQTVISDVDLEDTAWGASGELLATNRAFALDGLVVGIESDSAALVGDFTSDASTSGSDLTEATWLAAINKGRKLNWHRKGEPFCACIHPQQWMDLAGTLNDFSTFGANIAQPIIEDYANRPEYVGHPYGVHTFTSTLIPMTASNYIGGMFIPSALFFAYKRRPKVEIFRSQSKRWYEIQITVRYLKGELVDAWGVKLGTDA